MTSKLATLYNLLLGGPTTVASLLLLNKLCLTSVRNEEEEEVR